jgi:hypothetical protein
MSLCGIFGNRKGCQVAPEPTVRPAPSRVLLAQTLMLANQVEAKCEELKAKLDERSFAPVMDLYKVAQWNRHYVNMLQSIRHHDVDVCDLTDHVLLKTVCVLQKSLIWLQRIDTDSQYAKYVTSMHEGLGRG